MLYVAGISKAVYTRLYYSRDASIFKLYCPLLTIDSKCRCRMADVLNISD